MKMVCPHCYVNGIVDDSLIGRRVKCPKCTNIFVVSSDSSEPIEIDAIDLDTLDAGEVSPEASSEPDAIDDLDISDLLKSEDVHDDFPSEECEVCGKEVHPALLMEIDSKKYCASCVPDTFLSNDKAPVADVPADSGKQESTLVSIDDELATSEPASPPEDLQQEEAQLQPTEKKTKKKQRASTSLRLLLGFLIIALACAGAVVFLDIKLF